MVNDTHTRRRRSRIAYSTNSSMYLCNAYCLLLYCFCLVYCSASKTNVGLLRTFIKQLYDLRMSSRTGETTSQLLPELYIDNFDDEQIFQQLEMFNKHVVEEHTRTVKTLQTRPYGAATKVKNNSSLATQMSKHMTDESRSVKKQVKFESDSVPDFDVAADDIDEEEVEADSNIDSEEESALQQLLDSMSSQRTGVKNNSANDNDVDDDDDDEDSEAVSNSDSSGDDSDRDNDKTSSSGQHRTMLKRKNKQVSASAVDDRFFKLAEMEAFLDEQDLKEQRRDSSAADVTDDDDDDDDDDLSADDKVILLSDDNY